MLNSNQVLIANEINKYLSVNWLKPEEVQTIQDLLFSKFGNTLVTFELKYSFNNDFQEVEIGLKELIAYIVELELKYSKIN